MTARPRRTRLTLDTLTDRVVPSTTVSGNDLFANAAAVSGSSAVITGSNVGFTLEAGEPAPNLGNPYGPQPGASAWVRWTAPVNGLLTLDPTGSSFDNVVQVYTGSAADVTALTPALSVAAYNFPTQYPGTYPARLDVRAGQTYSIAVDGLDGQTGAYLVKLDLTPAPGNDDFALARVLTGGAPTPGTLDGATREPGEPLAPEYQYGTPDHYPTAWYTYTPGASGSVAITPTDATFTGVVQVGTGTSAADFTTHATGYFSSYYASAARLNVTAGETYHVLARLSPYQSGPYDGTNLTFTLTAAFTPPPANDDFANATTLTGVSAEGNGFNYGATGEAGEPDHAAGTVDLYGTTLTVTSKDPATGQLASAWWKWTAPRSGLAVVDTRNSTFDTTLGVYTGSAVGGLTKVGANDDIRVAEYVASEVAFQAVAGTTYSFAVDGEKAELGDVHISVGYRPANDDFANRQVLSTATNPVVRVTGSNVRATHEAGEPSTSYFPNTDLSVWYDWTAARSGTAVIDPGTTPYVIVYTGSAVNALTTVASTTYGAGGGGPIAFEAVAGTTYHVRVSEGYGVTGAPFAFTLFDGTATGVYRDGGTVYVFGSGQSDTVSVAAAGSKADGSTGVRVEATIGGKKYAAAFDTPVTGIDAVTGGGNDAVTVGAGLTAPVVAVLGAGSDAFQAGAGYATVFADKADGSGGGNDTVTLRDAGGWVGAGDGNNTVTAGGGVVAVSAGAGNDVVTVGSGPWVSLVLGDGNNHLGRVRRTRHGRDEQQRGGRRGRERHGPGPERVRDERRDRRGRERLRVLRPRHEHGRRRRRGRRAGRRRWEGRVHRRRRERRARRRGRGGQPLRRGRGRHPVRRRPGDPRPEQLVRVVPADRAAGRVGRGPRRPGHGRTGPVAPVRPVLPVEPGNRGVRPHDRQLLPRRYREGHARRRDRDRLVLVRLPRRGHEEAGRPAELSPGPPPAAWAAGGNPSSFSPADRVILRPPECPAARRGRHPREGSSCRPNRPPAPPAAGCSGPCSRCSPRSGSSPPCCRS